MRSFHKSWPPPNVSPDGQMPRSLKDSEKELRASLPSATDRAEHARAHFDALDKKKLRAVLAAEQNGLCVYCEQSLHEDSAVSIEHWRPLKVNPELALDWKNLYLSCRSSKTCDGSKGDRRLAWADSDSDLPYPPDVSYSDWVGFTDQGVIYVRASAHMNSAVRKALELAIRDQEAGGQRRQSILNLNDRTLTAARKAAIDSERKRIEKEFPDRNASLAKRKARADDLLLKKPYPKFVSIRVAWLIRLLGKDR